MRDGRWGNSALVDLDDDVGSDVVDCYAGCSCSAGCYYYFADYYYCDVVAVAVADSAGVVAVAVTDSAGVDYDMDAGGGNQVYGRDDDSLEPDGIDCYHPQPSAN